MTVIHSPRALRLVGILAVFVLTAVLGGTAAADDDDEEPKPLDRYFCGKVKAFKRGVVTLFYDFSEAKQMDDWFEGLPFPIKRRPEQNMGLKEGRVEILGSVGFQHVAAWKGDILVSAKITLSSTSDIGGLLSPDSGTHDFATFTLAEKFFHRWDKQRGGNHSIIKFGDQWKERFGGDFIGFRYVVRVPPAKDLIEGRSVKLKFGIKRGKLFMEVGDQDLKGKDLGKKLKVFRPGFYVAKAHGYVDDVEITGKLDPDWMKACGVAPTLENPIED